jgi:hypothetical protein
VKIADWPNDLARMAPATWAAERLHELGLDELAAYAYDEGEGWERITRILVATAAGILDVSERAASGDQAGPGDDVWRSEGELIPWGAVRRPRLTFTEFTSKRQLLVMFKLEHPELDRTEAKMPPLNEAPRTALVDFANECMRRASWVPKSD